MNVLLQEEPTPVPKVTIITPLHNKGPFIAETIRSVLKQTFSDWEMIVVENGSDDDGPASVGNFPDSRIRLIHSPRIGPGAARNEGLATARGEWILFLDADDTMEPECLASRLALLERAADAAFLVSRWSEATDGGRPEIKTPEGEGRTGRWVEDCSIAFPPWAVHAALVRRSCLGSNPWPEELDAYASEDTAFWFPLVQGKRIAYSGRCDVLYRIQPGNSRNEILDSLRWIDSVIAVTSRNIGYLKDCGRSPNPHQALFLAKGFENAATIAFEKGDRKGAKKALIHAKAWLPFCDKRSRAVRIRRLFGIPLLLRISLLIRCFRRILPL